MIIQYKYKYRWHNLSLYTYLYIFKNLFFIIYFQYSYLLKFYLLLSVIRDVKITYLNKSKI